MRGHACCGDVALAIYRNGPGIAAVATCRAVGKGVSITTGAALRHRVDAERSVPRRRKCTARLQSDGNLVAITAVAALRVAGPLQVTYEPAAPILVPFAAWSPTAVVEVSPVQSTTVTPGVVVLSVAHAAYALR